MKLPADSEIARVKVTHYLLKLREADDKSKFLAQAGYTVAHAKKLFQDLRGLLAVEAEFVQKTEYGDKYQICGRLIGPNGRQLRATRKTKFVTLYPDKNEI